MRLRVGICHNCRLRDAPPKDTDRNTDRNTVFLMSQENEMDPGEVPAFLPQLSQLEEIVIARAHVQMVVKRYRGHQYRYSGHCVTFLQNIVKTVLVLLNLLEKLNILIL